MQTHHNFSIGIELKLNYFNEFATCGIPVPNYTTDTGFVLNFDNAENYINYTNLLTIIMKDLEQADPDHHKYEIQRSIIFIKNLIAVMREQFYKTYN